MKKRILTLLLALGMLLSLAACGGQTAQPEEAQTEETSAAEESGPYDEAIALAEAGKYEEAVALLRTMEGDSEADALRKQYAFETLRQYLKEKGKPWEAHRDDEAGAAFSFPYAAKLPFSENTFAFFALDDSDTLVFGYSDEVPGVGFTILTNTLPDCAEQADVLFTASVRSGDRYQTDAAAGKITLATYQDEDDLTLEEPYVVAASNADASPVLDVEQAEVKGYEKLICEQLFLKIFEICKLNFADLGFDALDALHPIEFEAPAAQDSGTETDTEETAAADKTGKVEGAIDYETSEGRFVYKGWKYATNPSIQMPGRDDGKIILVYFEYTNYTDDERTPTRNFWARGYQNGVELYDLVGYAEDQSEEIIALGNKSKNILKDASIEFAWPYLLTDDSPVTVIVHTQGENAVQYQETQQIVIDPS